MILFRLLVLNTLNHVVVSDHDAHYEIATLILSKRNSSQRNTLVLSKGTLILLNRNSSKRNLANIRRPGLKYFWMSAVFPLEVRSRCKVVFVLLSCHPLGGFPTGSSLSSLAGEVPLIMSIRVTCRGSFSGYLIVKKEHTRRGRVTCSMFSGRQKVRSPTRS